MKESSKESKERKKVVVVEALTATTTCAGAGARVPDTAAPGGGHGGGPAVLRGDLQWGDVPHAGCHPCHRHARQRMPTSAVRTAAQIPDGEAGEDGYDGGRE